MVAVVEALAHLIVTIINVLARLEAVAAAQGVLVIILMCHLVAVELLVREMLADQAVIAIPKTN
jgi:hypothetical protein